MTPLRRRLAALSLAIGGAVALAGCAAAPMPLDAAGVDAVLSELDLEDARTTVGAALALAPDGMIGMIDARVAAGVSSTQHHVEGPPPVELHEWLVVGACGYPDALPSIEVAAIAPEDAEAFASAGAWNLACDRHAGDEPD